MVSSHGCYNDSKNQEKIKTILNISDGFTYVAAKNLNNINELQIDLPENNRLIYNGYKLESGTISKKREDVGLFTCPQRNQEPSRDSEGLPSVC